MRHIEGLYTQRYSRLRDTDEPLFRERYNAIPVDVDAYFLPLTSCIHRNPAETKRPLLTHLNDYAWPSNPAYIGSTAAPPWLVQGLTYELLGPKQKPDAYRSYVERSVDEEIATYNSKHRLSPILGSDEFIEKILENNSS